MPHKPDQIVGNRTIENAQGACVLVTGAMGFLGSAISENLVNLGYKILKLGKGPGNDFQVDISQGGFKLKTGKKIDYVVHAAGKAHQIPKTEIEIKDFYDVNFEGTKNFCRELLALPARPKAFIFISTVAVYGEEEGNLIPETHSLNGTSPYAKSKIMAESWLQNWGGENNIIIGILRLPLVAGFDPPGNLGVMIKGIRTGKYLSIGKANARKSIVWAADVASIIPKVAKTGGIFNLTDGYNPSFGELEAGIAAALHVKQVRKVPQGLARILAFAGDMIGRRSPVNSSKLRKITSTLTFDDSKARKILDWQPTRVLDKLQDMI